MGAEDKPGSTAPPPSGAGDPHDRDKSTPSIDELDSAWNEEEGLDEDATMVARVPHDLVALSRRGTELEKKPEAPEKHEAITARPPPGEASVVVDAPHVTVPKIAVPEAAPDEEDEGDEGDEDPKEAEDELDADELDAGWDIEEERAVAADVAAGLDVEARRRAAEARAVQRKEKARAKKLAAKDRRKARTDSIRAKAKQKKPRRRSTPPPRDALAARSSAPPKRHEEGRQHPTIPPKDPRGAANALAARRDLNRMVFFVAIVVVLGALAIGIARR